MEYDEVFILRYLVENFTLPCNIIYNEFIIYHVRFTHSLEFFRCLKQNRTEKGLFSPHP